eukprot:GHVT01086165.1.p1 GENE.GHVT01086165.1~~GHVT01086165.1.p1  ORF type:complete len:298 (+),score=43.77 GHVT01086165.1:170-1063(+)
MSLSRERATVEADRRDRLVIPKRLVVAVCLIGFLSTTLCAAARSVSDTVAGSCPGGYGCGSLDDFPKRHLRAQKHHSAAAGARRLLPIVFIEGETNKADPELHNGWRYFSGKLGAAMSGLVGGVSSVLSYLIDRPAVKVHGHDENNGWFVLSVVGGRGVSHDGPTGGKQREIAVSKAAPKKAADEAPVVAKEEAPKAIEKDISSTPEPVANGAAVQTAENSNAEWTNADKAISAFANLSMKEKEARLMELIELEANNSDEHRQAEIRKLLEEMYNHASAVHDSISSAQLGITGKPSA